MWPIRQLFAFLGCALLSSIWVAAAASAAQDDGKIVLGQSAPFSGPSAELGLRFNEGARLYFDAVNAKGGVHGRQIDLRQADDGYEPERTKENTKKFIADGALALFGYVGTPTTLAAEPLATAAKIPLIAPFTGASALREPLNRYLIHIRASYDDETRAIVRHTASVGQAAVAVFYQNDAYGLAGLNGVTKALGHAPVAVGTVERNSLDVAKAVKTIVAARPHAIVQIGSYTACAAFIRAARAAGFGGAFYNVSFVGTKALTSALGAAATGVVVSQVMPYPFSPRLPITTEYLAAIKAGGRSSLEPNYSGMEGFVAAKVMVEALQRTGKTLNAETLINAFDTMQKVNLGGFSVDLGAGKHAGSDFVEMTILTGDGRVRR